MILEAKAKPVKFRIRSGGEEHSSLESLRSNFVWEDIKPLCGSGKQLEKWLERIDAEVAKEYKDIENTEDNVLGVYNVLFRKNQTKLHEYKDVFQECMALIESRKEEGQNQNKEIELNNLLRLCRCLIPKLSAKELIQSAKKYWMMYELFEEDLLMHMRDNQKLMSPEDLFTAGKLVFESGNNQELAIECIQASSSKGIKAASDFVKKHITGIAKVSASDDSLDVLFKDNEIMECISDSWQAKTSINPSSNRGMKNKLFMLSDACLNIVKASWSNLEISRLSSIAEHYIGRDIKKTDPLRDEKLFVLGLFGRTFDEARNRMIEIENSYPIAKFIARGAANGYNMYGDWESHLFSIRDNRRTENADHLEYFIKNLPKFRKDV